jgi:LmbE family N-acetylglucosaminyl deacetylase
MASISAFPARYSYGSDQDLERMLGRPILAGRVHIVVIGAHPDDPETGCGGTIAKLTGDGHRVTIIYLTRGEAGIRGGHHDSAGTYRGSSRWCKAARCASGLR